MTKPEDIPQWAWEKAEAAINKSMTMGDATAHLARAILSAVEEEREACGAIADEGHWIAVAVNPGSANSPMEPWWNGLSASEIASAIRNRKES